MKQLDKVDEDNRTYTTLVDETVRTIGNPFFHRD